MVETHTRKLGKFSIRIVLILDKWEKPFVLWPEKWPCYWTLLTTITNTRNKNCDKTDTTRSLVI